MQEKIKVNLSYNCYNLLIKDMESFQFFKQDNTINKNLFFNTLVQNMYERYQIEYEETRKKIVSLVEHQIKEENLINDIIFQINELIAYKLEDTTNRSHGYYISFRPSKKMEELYNKIEYEHLENSSISNYYRNLLNRYSKMPQDVREEIVFSKQKEIILKAIRLKRKLKIELNQQILSFIPYALVKTEDEQYNYLIGGIRKGSYLRVFSLHLYKLQHIYISKDSFTLSIDEERYFESSIIKGPRELNARSTQTKIALTEKGITLFKKMYLNRPIPEKIEGNVYSFNCSADNLFIYFSRFGKEALVLEPLNLKNQLKKFYNQAYYKYNE